MARSGIRLPSGLVIGGEEWAQAENNPKIEKMWEPNAMQDRALRRMEKEVLLAGSKFGGKSEVARIWMVSGNPDKPNYDEKGSPLYVNMSYVYHPMYLGVVVRLNEKDLREWVDKARPYYEMLGGRFNKSPAQFEFAQSGAKIFLGHAEDKDAYTKFQGLNIVRFLVEEAGQIARREVFDQIRSCVRSVYPEMRAQIWYTANPGGPGQEYLFDRFMEPKDREGNVLINANTGLPWRVEDGGMTTIVEEVENPFRKGEKVSTSRVWVPSYFTDNPHAMNDPDYLAALATLDSEKLRRAYLFGDWRAMRGTYFETFKKETHTFDPKLRQVAGWWRASGSLDWGFEHDSAAYLSKQDPETKQTLVYNELVVSRTDPIELGAALARFCKVELAIQGAITFYISHDMFHNRIGEFTWADLLARGAAREIGRDYVHIPESVLKHLKESYSEGGKEWDENLDSILLSKRKPGITFVRAPRSRAVGFMYMRSMMSLESSTKPRPEFDYNFSQTLAQEGNMESYFAYLKLYREGIEILPKLLISSACPVLISAIPKAIHDPDHPEDIDPTHFKGMDSLDSVRYLLGGIRDDPPSLEPLDVTRSRLVMEALSRNPSLSTPDLIWMSRERGDEKESRDNDGFNLGRRARFSRYLPSSDSNIEM